MAFSMASGEAALDYLATHEADLVISDVKMPGMDGLTLLRRVTSQNTGTVVVMMSGHGTVETAVEATRLGAYDFVEKPLSIAKLLLVVRRALESAQLQLENVGLRGAADTVLEPESAHDP